jgi:hypothetical protein
LATKVSESREGIERIQGNEKVFETVAAELVQAAKR